MVEWLRTLIFSADHLTAVATSLAWVTCHLKISLVSPRVTHGQATTHVIEHNIPCLMPRHATPRLTGCTIVMSIVKCDDFTSLIAFAGQLISCHVMINLAI